MQERETIVALLRAIGNYIYRRIEGQSHRDTYEKAMKRCIELASNEQCPIVLQQLIKEYSDSSELLYPKRFFSMNNNHVYHKLACSNALEAIDSINVRFVTGGHGLFPVRSEGGFFYEDKSIF